MLFRTEPSGVLAISQPAHAWVSGQILRAWDEPLGQPLLLAAEQHDIGWLDWETAPTSIPRPGARISFVRSARQCIRRCGGRASSARSALGALMSRFLSRGTAE